MPSDARVAALVVLRRTFEHDAYSDRAFQAAASGLDSRDRAFAMRLAYGAVQRRATLDYLIAACAERPVAKLDPPVRAALRLGAYELCFMGSAPHAAVNDAVELAGSSRGQGLVNAVLRRIAREQRELLARLDERTPEGAATLHSVPPWIVAEWWAALGPAAARALLARCNEPAEHALRANTLLTDAATLAAALDVATSVPGDPPEAVCVLEPFDAHGSPLWRAGHFMPQSRAAMLVAHVLDVKPGDRVLDMCAAPGGKTTHIAALLAGRGEIVAIERHRGRAEALQRTIARMHASHVTVQVADAGGVAAGGPQFDRVLLDAPCSGLGTIHSRPDLRWRVSPDAVHALVAEQARLLSAAALALAPGGTLVYSTCTISAAENELQIGAFLDQHREFAPIDLESRFPAWVHPRAHGQLLALPHIQGSDGFYIAALQRRGPPQ
ncbi:MAG: 16S rRNA (cytosine(967)-C(5))-methyltransferase RsmB [Solirubrobacteraceae bacterium]|jgi:16S rRNA (cytosine967-C5)-methyltransferase